MTEQVQLMVAESVAEAEEIQAILRDVGIEAELAPAVEHHPREIEDAPLKVLVAETDLETARDAVEAFGEPDELDGDE